MTTMTRVIFISLIPLSPNHLLQTRRFGWTTSRRIAAMDRASTKTQFALRANTHSHTASVLRW